MKARLSNIKNTLLAFPTPIHQSRHEDLQTFNQELASRILSLRDQSPGEKRSNAGGWHSDAQLLHKLGEPLGSRLGRMFVEDVRTAMEAIVEITQPLPDSVSVDAWANINQRGDSNMPHIHGGSAWSGVYYVATDARPEAAGKLVFSDPRTAALMLTHPFNPFNATSLIQVVPVAGMMLVFPSFLSHYVEVYQGDVPRISIAFNLR